jgi:fatty acid desaturase
MRRALAGFVRPSNLHGFLHVGGDYAVVIASFVLWPFLATRVHSAAALVALWVVDVLVLSSRIRAFESSTHEATHSTLFKTRRFNTSLQFFFAQPVLHCIAAYRAGHMVHHWKLGHEDDPIEEFFRMNDVLDLPRRRAWLLFWRPLLGYQTLGWIREKINYWREFPDFRLRTTSFALFVAAVGLLTGRWEWLLWHYGVALAYVFPIIEFHAEIGDHLSLDWDRAAGHSRNNIGVLHRWFLHTHNDGFHAVHHINHGIPAHLLPAAHEQLMEIAGSWLDIVSSRGLIETYRQVERGGPRPWEPPAVTSR